MNDIIKQLRAATRDTNYRIGEAFDLLHLAEAIEKERELSDRLAAALREAIIDLSPSAGVRLRIVDALNEHTKTREDERVAEQALPVRVQPANDNVSMRTKNRIREKGPLFHVIKTGTPQALGEPGVLLRSETANWLGWLPSSEITIDEAAN